MDPDSVTDRSLRVFTLSARESSRWWGRYAIEIEALDSVIGSRVTAAIAPAFLRAPDFEFQEEAAPGFQLALSFDPVDPAATQKGFAFISGCPGDAFRYRCEHQAQSLRLFGHSVDVFPADTFPFDQILSSYAVVVAHRVPHTREFDRFARRAKDRGVHLIYDTDDLVFDPSILSRIGLLDDMTASERELYEDGVRRYRRALELCPAVSVSTPALEESVRRQFPEKRVAITRNRLSEQMIADAAQKVEATRAFPDDVCIGYLSGTRTHRLDFEECVEALDRVMQRHPEARLLLVGHIDVPDRLEPYRERIDHHELVPWQELPRVIQSIDINLAPLEPDNPFTAGKSELKFLEAGVCGVPTVASPIGGYRDAIRHGENGFLCATTDEWVQVLSDLVQDADLRERVGDAARETVLGAYTTRALAPATADAFRGLAGRDPIELLRIAFVLRAPIAQTGGGYKKIFQLAHFLADRGHRVDLYVEPIAHLAGADEARIRSFCARHFGDSEAKVHRGHEAIADCDVAVATNWPTASVVAALPNARLRAYFVQDYEPEFYEERDPLYREAELTYDLPLLAITIGGYLAKRLEARNGLPYPHVPFALSDHFFADGDAVERELREGEPRPARVLFFARPEIPRRRFELGVAALERLHALDPRVEIHLYGSENLPPLSFPHTNLGVLEPEALVRAMRSAAVHLSFSATNATTVIFEAMASGCDAVDLDQEGVRDLVSANTCVHVEAEPDAIARTLCELFDTPDATRRLALRGLEAARGMSVERMCQEFEQILRAAVLPRRVGSP